MQQYVTAPQTALRAEASQVVAFDGLLVLLALARGILEVERRGAGLADAAGEPPPIKLILDLVARGRRPRGGHLVADTLGDLPADQRMSALVA